MLTLVLKQCSRGCNEVKPWIGGISRESDCLITYIIGITLKIHVHCVGLEIDTMVTTVVELKMYVILIFLNSYAEWGSRHYRLPGTKMNTTVSPCQLMLTSILSIHLPSTCVCHAAHRLTLIHKCHSIHGQIVHKSTRYKYRQLPHRVIL